VNEVFIATPVEVTLEMIGDVLRRTWNLDEDLVEPQVEIGLGKRAYVTEVEAEATEDPLFFHAGERDRLRQRIGDYRIFSVRYTSPALGRDVARAIANSELGHMPMLLEQAAREWPPGSDGVPAQ
jgi:hypothetical protein